LIFSVLFNTEIHYSPHRLQQGVAVESGDLFSKTLKDSPFLRRNNEVKNELSMQGTAHQEHFKRVYNVGCLRLIFDSLLSVIAGSRFFDILSTNNLKILQNLESLLGMYIETTVG
jgi:hypothetical protein